MMGRGCSKITDAAMEAIASELQERWYIMLVLYATLLLPLGAWAHKAFTKHDLPATFLSR